MRMRIEAETEAERARVSQLLHLTLAPARTDIADVRVSIANLKDPLGMNLTHCGTEIRTRHGDRVSVEETQSTLDLSVKRALERSLRTIQRRLSMEKQLLLLA